MTYLDTAGRPTITLSKKHLTEKHTGLVYVELNRPGCHLCLLTLVPGIVPSVDHCASDQSRNGHDSICPFVLADVCDPANRHTSYQVNLIQGAVHTALYMELPDKDSQIHWRARYWGVT